jgi:PAS domain S-box-containing protein
MSYLVQWLNGTGLPPHGFCLLWQPGLIWLHVVSDALIGVSYYAIPLALAYLVTKRRNIVFGWIFWMFVAFILACGTTHFMDIWVLWHADYGIQGLIKAATAALSLLTAVMLWPLVLRALALPLPAEFQRLSDQLASEAKERIQAMRSLRHTERSFRMLVDGVTDHAIFMLDPNGCVSSWNTGARRIIGYTEAEITGRHFSAFYRSDREADGPTHALETAAQGGKFEAESWCSRKDGSQFRASIVIQPIHDEAGQLVGHANIIRDVTERRKAEETLEQVRQALARTQKLEAVGQLTGGVAHDFNNLLQAVSTNLDLAQEAVERGDALRAQRLLGKAIRTIGRGARLTAHLLAFSRRQTLQPENIAVDQLLGSMRELLRRAMGETIALELHDDVQVWPCCVDSAQLEAAILNLVINARDAMPPQGGRIAIEVCNATLDPMHAEQLEIAPGDYVQVDVTDTGSGMTAEVLARAFEPFFTTKDVGKGSGLGLAQVHGFMGQSGGAVSIQSKAGHGTTVSLFLPRSHVAEVKTVHADPDPIFSGGGRTVLVVEDEPDVRESICELLEEAGYRVILAEDAQTARRILASDEPISALFADVVLPGGVSGMKLAREVRRLRQDMPVLLTSGYARDVLLRHGTGANEFEILAKPYVPRDLLRRLGTLVAVGGTVSRSA